MIPVCHPVPRGLRSLSLRATQNGLRKPLPRKHIYLYLPPKTPHPPARAAEYLIRYLVVHPHVKERLIPPALLFYLFRYDFLIPKDFRLLHPRNAAPQNAASRSIPSGSSNTACGIFCAIVYIFQSCTSGERQTPSMLKPFFSLAAMVPVRLLLYSYTKSVSVFV